MNRLEAVRLGSVPRFLGDQLTWAFLLLLRSHFYCSYELDSKGRRSSIHRYHYIRSKHYLLYSHIKFLTLIQPLSNHALYLLPGNTSPLPNLLGEALGEALLPADDLSGGEIGSPFSSRPSSMSGMNRSKELSLEGGERPCFGERMPVREGEEACGINSELLEKESVSVDSSNTSM